MLCENLLWNHYVFVCLSQRQCYMKSFLSASCSALFYLSSNKNFHLSFKGIPRILLLLFMLFLTLYLFWLPSEGEMQKFQANSFHAETFKTSLMTSCNFLFFFMKLVLYCSRLSEDQVLVVLWACLPIGLLFCHSRSQWCLVLQCKNPVAEEMCSVCK